MNDVKLFKICFKNFQANLDLFAPKHAKLVKRSVASSHSVMKRAAGDDPKQPDMPMPKLPDIKLPQMPKLEIPQIKMRRKRQDTSSPALPSIPMGILDDFKKIANSTQTQISKFIPGIGSLFS